MGEERIGSKFSSFLVANKILLIREDELGHMLGFDPVLEAPYF